MLGTITTSYMDSLETNRMGMPLVSSLIYEIMCGINQFFIKRQTTLRVFCINGFKILLVQVEKKHFQSSNLLLTVMFCVTTCTHRRIQGGLLGLSPPPGPVKSIDFRGFSCPNGCWAPLEKNLSPPWTNSWIRSCLYIILTLKLKP